MKIFIDSADIKEIKKALKLGIIDGVTTNPSLIAKTGKTVESCIKEILEIISTNPVNVEVLATDYKTILSEAKHYATWSKNIVIKIPITKKTIEIIKILSNEGIKINVTLCFSPMQALLAAKVGATYISPFVGRLDDIAHNGMELIQQIVEIYTNYAFDTKILIASIRHPIHVTQAALIGADIATIPLKIINTIFNHPLTNLGLKQFLADWENKKNKVNIN